MIKIKYWHIHKQLCGNKMALQVELFIFFEQGMQLKYISFSNMNKIIEPRLLNGILMLNFKVNGATSYRGLIGKD